MDACLSVCECVFVCIDRPDHTRDFYNRANRPCPGNEMIHVHRRNKLRFLEWFPFLVYIVDARHWARCAPGLG